MGLTKLSEIKKSELSIIDVEYGVYQVGWDEVTAGCACACVGFSATDSRLTLLFSVSVADDDDDDESEEDLPPRYVCRGCSLRAFTVEMRMAYRTTFSIAAIAQTILWLTLMSPTS